MLSSMESMSARTSSRVRCLFMFPSGTRCLVNGGAAIDGGSQIMVRFRESKENVDSRAAGLLAGDVQEGRSAESMITPAGLHRLGPGDRFALPGSRLVLGRDPPLRLD